MDSERTFILGFAVVFIGVISFGFGHIQGKRNADPALAGGGGPATAGYVAYVPEGTDGGIGVYAVPTGHRLSRIAVLPTGDGAGDLAMIAGSRDANGKPDGAALFAVDKQRDRVARIDLPRGTVSELKSLSGGKVGVRGAADVVHIGARGLVAVSGEFDDDGGHVLLLRDSDLSPAFAIKLPTHSDRLGASADGKWLLASAYNTERADSPLGMRKSSEDVVYAIDLEACQKAADGGVVDPFDKEREQPLAAALPVLSGPTSLTTYARETEKGTQSLLLVGSAWSDVVAIFDLGKIQPGSANSALLTEVQVGTSPVQSVVASNGLVYTACAGSSELVVWRLEEALGHQRGYQVSRTPVAYNATGLVGAHEEDGRLRALLCLTSFSLDRHPSPGSPAGAAIFAANGTGRVKLAAHVPLPAAAASAVLLRADSLKSGAERDETPKAGASDDRVTLTVARSSIQPASFEVKAGAKVTLAIHNLERGEGRGVALAVHGHPVSYQVAPGQTVEKTFRADQPGTYWIYTSTPTAVGARTTRARMIVK